MCSVRAYAFGGHQAEEVFSRACRHVRAVVASGVFERQGGERFVVSVYDALVAVRAGVAAAFPNEVFARRQGEQIAVAVDVAGDEAGAFGQLCVLRAAHGHNLVVCGVVVQVEFVGCRVAAHERKGIGLAVLGHLHGFAQQVVVVGRCQGVERFHSHKVVVCSVFLIGRQGFG